MKKLDSGIFQVADKETINLEVTDTGAQTNFGVNYNIFGQTGVVPNGQPLPILMDKARATKNSKAIPGARVAELTVECSFDSSAGGKYDVKLTGAPGGDPPSQESVEQFDPKLPNSVFYVFHIV